MGSGLGEKDTDDDKGRTGRTEPSAHAFCGKTDTAAYSSEEEKKTVKEITLAVYEYLVQEKIQEQLAELEQKFQEDGELALAKEYAQIYRIVLELFDKFVELLGEEEIPLKEYCELLDAGLEEAKGWRDSSKSRSGCDRRCGKNTYQKYPRIIFCRSK